MWEDKGWYYILNSLKFHHITCQVEKSVRKDKTRVKGQRLMGIGGRYRVIRSCLSEKKTFRKSLLEVTWIQWPLENDSLVHRFPLFLILISTGLAHFYTQLFLQIHKDKDLTKYWSVELTLLEMGRCSQRGHITQLCKLDWLPVDPTTSTLLQILFPL